MPIPTTGDPMKPARTSTPPQSLASAHPGQLLRIQRILFGGLRSLCAEQGVGEGDLVVWLGQEPAAIRLATADGRRILLRREWAPFIQVSLAEQELGTDTPDLAPIRAG
jgi:hypothetical protein